MKRMKRKYKTKRDLIYTHTCRFAILTRRKMFVISLMAFFVGLITMLLGLVALDVFTTSVGFLAFAGGYLAIELEEV